MIEITDEKVSTTAFKDGRFYDMLLLEVANLIITINILDSNLTFANLMPTSRLSQFDNMRTELMNALEVIKKLNIISKN